MRPAKIGLVLVIVAVAAAAGWYFLLRKPAQQAGPGGPPAGMAIPVEAVAAKRADLTVDVQAVGSLRSNESVIIRPEIAGRVASINFQEGQPARAGDVLVRLDDSLYRAELNQARAALVLSRTNYERASRLFQERVGTQRTLDEAVAALRNDEARVAGAETRLEKTVLSAPFSGIVGLRKVSVGDFVNVGQDIVNHDQIDPLKVDFRVAETQLGHLDIGQTILVHVDAFPEQEFEGKVYAIDPQVDMVGRSIALRADMANREMRLRPGLFARVRLIVTRAPDAILIPEEALIPVGDDRFVLKVVDGKAVRTKVTLGERYEGRVRVVGGIAEGDLVITAGQIKVQDGMPVQVAPPDGGAAGAGGANPHGGTAPDAGQGASPGSAGGNPPGAPPGGAAPGGAGSSGSGSGASGGSGGQGGR
jgi:membrane fusion protein (multidrug efflux system)